MIEEPDSYEVKTGGVTMKVSKVPAQADPIPDSVVSDPVTAFMMMLRQHSFEMECCTPAAVLSFDRASHIATVLPLCRRRTNTKQSITPMPIRVHVWRYACGGVIIDLPVKVGDTGWLIAGDIDSTYAKEKNASFDPSGNEGSQEPQTNDIHRYRFGLFLPDSFCDFEDIEQYGDDPVIGTYDEDGVITPIDFGGDPDPTKCVTSLNEYTGDIVITAGDNVSIEKETTSDGKKRIKISSTDTDTTYGAGFGISINGSNVISSTFQAGTGINFLGTVINNSGVLSVNDITGEVTLSAGTNITISKSGNTITINGSGGDGFGMFKYDKATKSIGGGYVMAPRNLVQVSGQTYQSMPSNVYIKVQVNMSSGSISGITGSLVTAAGSNTDLITYIPLYSFDAEGNITMDYRGMPVVSIYEQS